MSEQQIYGRKCRVFKICGVDKRQNCDVVGDVIIHVIISALKNVHKQVTYRLLIGRGD